MRYKQNHLKQIFTSISRISLLITILLLSKVAPIHAGYKSLGFSPQTGKIHKTETKITVNVDSGEDKFTAIRPVVQFAGAVKYLRYEKSSTSPCTPTVNEESSGEITITCLSTAGEKYKGGLVDLYFKATGTGTSKFSFQDDPGDGIPITEIGTGTYTVAETTTNSTTTTTGSNTNTTNKLPQTYNNHNHYITAFGVILLITGIFFQPISLIFRNIRRKIQKQKLYVVE